MISFHLLFAFTYFCSLTCVNQVRLILPYGEQNNTLSPTHSQRMVLIFTLFLYQMYDTSISLSLSLSLFFTQVTQSYVFTFQRFYDLFF